MPSPIRIRFAPLDLRIPAGSDGKVAPIRYAGREIRHSAAALGSLLAGNLGLGYLGAERFLVMGIHLHLAISGWVLLVAGSIGVVGSTLATAPLAARCSALIFAAGALGHMAQIVALSLRRPH